MNNEKTVNQEEVNEMVKERNELFKKKQEEIDAMLKSGNMSIMTECAYGSVIADCETKSKL